MVERKRFGIEINKITAFAGKSEWPIERKPSAIARFTRWISS